MSFYTVDFGVNFANQSRYPKSKLDEIIAQSWNYGVDKVVSISNDFKECETNRKLLDAYPNLYCTIGLHPHHAKNFSSAKFNKIQQYITLPK